MANSPLSDRPIPNKFRFPWEIRQLIILALMSRKTGGLTVNNDQIAESILHTLENSIGVNTGWKTGEDLFGSMTTGLSEEVVQFFLFMILGKILMDNKIESQKIKQALHGKNLIGALEDALALLKTIN